MRCPAMVRSAFPAMCEADTGDELYEVKERESEEEGLFARTADPTWSQCG